MSVVRLLFRSLMRTSPRSSLASLGAAFSYALQGFTPFIMASFAAASTSGSSLKPILLWGACLLLFWGTDGVIMAVGLVASSRVRRGLNVYWSAWVSDTELTPATLNDLDRRCADGTRRRSLDQMSRVGQSFDALRDAFSFILLPLGLVSSLALLQLPVGWLLVAFVVLAVRAIVADRQSRHLDAASESLVGLMGDFYRTLQSSGLSCIAPPGFPAGCAHG